MSDMSLAFEHIPTTGAAAPRFDIYVLIHKALRAYMCDTLLAVARADADDARDVSAVLAQVRELAGFCANHLRHENDFVHAAMDARRPGSAAQTAGDHVHHEEELDRLRSLADAVEKSGNTERTAALLQLYSCLALFVAENFTHMNVEETQNNTALWSAYTDDELMEIERALVASIAPEEMALVMRWMIPSMSAGERAEMLSGIRASAPEPVFGAMLGIARAHLSDRDWGKLSQALDLPEPLAA